LSTTGYTYYKNDDALRPSSSASPHSRYFAVKFDTIAYSVLTDDGKLPVDGTFPVGSLVVKELYDTEDGALVLYAVMKKSASENAKNGWLWAEFKADGATFYSVSEKGASCVGCHSINHRDYMRLFDLFP
jgi:Cytochrome P460